MIIERIYTELGIEQHCEKYQNQLDMDTNINPIINSFINIDSIYLGEKYLKNFKLKNIFILNVNPFLYDFGGANQVYLDYHLIMEFEKGFQRDKIILMFKNKMMAREYFKILLKYFNKDDDFEIKNISDSLPPQYKI